MPRKIISRRSSEDFAVQLRFHRFLHLTTKVNWDITGLMSGLLDVKLVPHPTPTSKRPAPSLPFEDDGMPTPTSLQSLFHAMESLPADNHLESPIQPPSQRKPADRWDHSPP